MTQTNIVNALNLLGFDSAYPNSVSWGSSINLTFLDYIPAYYPPGYSLGFVGHNTAGVLKNFDEPGLFSSLTEEQKGWVRVAIEGNGTSIGFSQFTAATVTESAQSSLAPTGITFGHLNYLAQSQVAGAPLREAGAVTLSIGAQTDSYWSDGLLEVPDEKAAGDVWIFSGGVNDRGTYVHELGHALGLYHSFNDLSLDTGGFEAQYNSAKYTVMAYSEHPAEGKSTYDWQILDIAALQYHYGVGSFNTGSNLYSDFSYSDGSDRIISLWDSGGDDTISAGDYASNSYIDLRPGYFSSIGRDAFITNETYVVGNVGSDNTVTLGRDSTLGRENVSIAFGAYIENARGSTDNDVLIGNALSNRLEGNSGNDILLADGFSIKNADDVLQLMGRAETGLVQLSPIATSDADYRQVEQGVGLSAVGSSAAAFVSDISLQKDRIYGDEGDDLVVGGNGEDILEGGDGDDILIASDGVDILDGGDGGDILVGQGDGDLFTPGSGTNTIWGGEYGQETSEAIDTVDFSRELQPLIMSVSSYTGVAAFDDNGSYAELHAIDVVKSHLSKLMIEGQISTDHDKLTIYANEGEAIVTGKIIDISLSESRNSIVIDQFGNGQINDLDSGGIIEFLGFDANVIGSNYHDIITVEAVGERELDAGAGDDIVTVTGGSATVSGGDGDDAVTTGSGADILIGGAGGDVLHAGDGSDEVDGGLGSDNLFGGGGNDVMWGGPEFDGYSDIDYLNGGSGDDEMHAGDAQSWLYGEDGDDTLYSGSSDAGYYLNGGVGNDKFFVNATDTEIIGGEGNDEYNFDGFFQQEDGVIVNLSGSFGHDVVESGTATFDLAGYYQSDLKYVWDADVVSFDGEQYQMVGDLALVVKSTGDSILFRDVTGWRQGATTGVVKETWMADGYIGLDDHGYFQQGNHAGQFTVDGISLIDFYFGSTASYDVLA